MTRDSGAARGGRIEISRSNIHKGLFGGVSKTLVMEVSTNCANIVAFAWFNVSHGKVRITRLAR
jgi:hypothetical protein